MIFPFFAVLWEGAVAVEECSDVEPRSRNTTKTPQQLLTPELKPEPLSESEEDIDSEDEYVADTAKPKGKSGPAKVCTDLFLFPIDGCHSHVFNSKRRTRRLSFSSESEGSDSDNGGRSRRTSASAGKVSASPGPSRHSFNHKRKTTNASQPPPSKRKKVSETDPADDPARKYCLGKLEEVFRDIFLRYPHVRVVDPPEGEGEGEGKEIRMVNKPLEEMSDEEKSKLEDEARQFATDLEQCVYDIYSELDKQGNPSAAGKYKCVQLFRFILNSAPC